MGDLRKDLDLRQVALRAFAFAGVNYRDVDINALTERLNAAIHLALSETQAFNERRQARLESK